MAEDENPFMGEDGEMIETSNSRDIFTKEGELVVEPYIDMHFESEEAAKDMIFDMVEDENPLMVEDGEMIETSNSRDIFTKDGDLVVEPYIDMHFESEEAAKDMIYEMLDDENPLMGGDGETIEPSNTRDIFTKEGNLVMEPYIGMRFESEEAAKFFYNSYAKHVGFIMRVDAFRRSVDDGNVVWRRLVCNKQGFSKCRHKNRKSRVITREGCKAMMSVKRDKTGNWVVQRFVKEHNHPLVVAAASTNHRRAITFTQTSQTSDDKDVKILELTAELQRERKKSAALQEQLDMVLKDMEEHSNHLSRNIDGIIQSVKKIESRNLFFHSSLTNELLY